MSFLHFKVWGAREKLFNDKDDDDDDDDDDDNTDEGITSRLVNTYKKKNGTRVERQLRSLKVTQGYSTVPHILGST